MIRQSETMLLRVDCGERQDMASHYLVIRKPDLDTSWFPVVPEE